METSKVVCSTEQRTVEQIVDGPMPQVHEQIVEVVKVIPQDRISERSVEQIVEVVHSIPMEVESAQMERFRGKSTDQRRAKTTSGEDCRGSENRAASRRHAVPTLFSWKESQDRIQQPTSEQVANNVSSHP